MHEVGGALVPAMKRYLAEEALEPGDIELIRVYLIQWIYSPVWGYGCDDEMRIYLNRLRDAVLTLRTREAIHLWINGAVDIGLDPL
jgi:hypothetical protein